jgi:hypothetical protein
MKSFLTKIVFLLVAAGLIAGLIFAFIAGHKEAGAEAEREKPIKAPSRVEVVNGENVVTFDQATQSISGIELRSLGAVQHRHEISAYGVVVDLQELTDLRNALETGEAQMNKARSAREVASQEYERVKTLYENNQNVSQKVVQAAEGTLRAEESNVRAADAALHAAQATALQHWGSVLASWLTQATPQFEQLRSQKDLLVQVTLPPGQGGVAAPPTASVQTAEGRLIPATFVSLAPRTDAKIQGMSFFYIVAAEGSSLLPGMIVAARLPSGDPTPGVVVPASAVVWLQGKPWAYVQLQSNRFARREVSTDQPVPNGWFQPRDFSGGQPIVAKGPQVLLSEEFRAQIQIGD